MFTPPPDLATATIADVLLAGWGFAATSLDYQAVGFGSHHWLATAADGARLFATVDDLPAKLRSAQEHVDDAFARLEVAFGTCLSLRADAGLTFVLAPIPDADGRVLRRLGDHFSLVVHPFVEGRHVSADGDFTSSADRSAVLDLLVRLHSAPSTMAAVDDFSLPCRDELAIMLDDPDSPWLLGPYGERARMLLRAHAPGVRTLLAAYDSLAAQASARPERMVVTHGEPHARNVLLTADGFVLLDWDTVLLAPPERDLWDLCQGDVALLATYAQARGVEVDPDGLELYRLTWDLAEIGLYLSQFHGPHTQTTDIAESWTGLQFYLRPAERWPHLCR